MKGILKALAWFALYFAFSLIFQVLLTLAIVAACSIFVYDAPFMLPDILNKSMLILITLTNALLVLAFFLVFRLRKKSVRQEWRLRPFTVNQAVLAAVTAFSGSFLFSLCTYRMPMDNWLLLTQSAAYYNELLPPLGWLLLLLATLTAAPISEEMVFRGIIFTRAEMTAGPVAAMLVSAALFGVMHIDAGGVPLAVGAMLMGCVFGYLFYKTGSLWVSIIAHAAANLPDFVLFTRSELPAPLMIGLCILCACVFIAGMLAVHKTTRNNQA